MRTCLDRLISQAHIDAPRVREETDYVTNRLEQCRQDSTISNDAFLDAGAIQGALGMIGNHIEMGISQNEIHELILQQIERAERIEEKHPGLDAAIESGR